MSRIDNYLQSMDRFKATGLVLSSGSNVVLKFPAGDRAATQTTTHAQVRELIREIAPAKSMSEIERGSMASFSYQGASSNYDVSVLPKGAIWKVMVSPASAAAAGSVDAPLEVERSPLAGLAESSAPRQYTPPPAESFQTPKKSERSLDSQVAIGISGKQGISREESGWIDRILRHMMEAGASDVHLSSASIPYWRVDGNIERIPWESEMDPDFLEKQIESISPKENWQEFCQRNDTDFAYEVPGLSRFRVNVFRDRKGVGTVMRTIPFEIPSAEELGLPDAVLDMANLSKGLVLVTGPTGSGKSTTLAALIDHINLTRKDHLITIEDPIEFVHPNKQCLVNQREVKRHTNSFKDALRAALREDPDIVLVGEMRDLETIEIAVETAETGHLVFGTLHTTTAPSTVDRIIDQFPPDRQEQIRQMLSTSLKGVISQVLCRKKGGGRVAAHEILIGTPAVSNLIRESKTFQLFSLMQTNKNLGMIKLEDSLMKLVNEDQIEPLEAYRRANNKQEFATMLKRAGIVIANEGTKGH